MKDQDTESGDDLTYLQEKSTNTLSFSDNYRKFLAWKPGSQYTGTQASFADWLLQEPQLSKIKQIGDLDSVFTDVRRFVKGLKPIKYKS